MRVQPQELLPETQPESALPPHSNSGIARLAQRGLWESRYSALRNVICDEFGGVIRLGGRVPTQYLKQVAFAIVCEVVGSRPVINEIQVVPLAGRDRAGTLDSASSGWFQMGRRV